MLLRSEKEISRTSWLDAAFLESGLLAVDLSVFFRELITVEYKTHFHLWTAFV